MCKYSFIAKAKNWFLTKMAANEAIVPSFVLFIEQIFVFFDEIWDGSWIRRIKIPWKLAWYWSLKPISILDNEKLSRFNYDNQNHFDEYSVHVLVAEWGFDVSMALAAWPFDDVHSAPEFHYYGFGEMAVRWRSQRPLDDVHSDHSITFTV